MGPESLNIPLSAKVKRFLKKNLLVKLPKKLKVIVFLGPQASKYTDCELDLLRQTHLRKCLGKRKDIVPLGSEASRSRRITLAVSSKAKRSKKHNDIDFKS